LDWIRREGRNMRKNLSKKICWAKIKALIKYIKQKRENKINIVIPTKIPLI
jgi:hypothetical protein